MAKLYFKFGTMGSSKTAQALMTKFNYEQKGMKVLLIKPSLAIRDEAKVRSRIGLESDCKLVTKKDNLTKYVSNESVVIVDEAQFLTSEQVEQLRYIADHFSIPVFCYGLRTDFQTNLFEGSKRLFEVADSIEDIKNICSCGRKAVFNARFCDGRIQTEGDSIEKEVYTYEPLCSVCYRRKLEQEERMRRFFNETE